jgi:hypothetical protein
MIKVKHLGMAGLAAAVVLAGSVGGDAYASSVDSVTSDSVVFNASNEPDVCVSGTSIVTNAETNCDAGDWDEARGYGLSVTDYNSFIATFTGGTISINGNINDIRGMMIKLYESATQTDNLTISAANQAFLEKVQTSTALNLNITGDATITPNDLGYIKLLAGGQNAPVTVTVSGDLTFGEAAADYEGETFATVGNSNFVLAEVSGSITPLPAGTDVEEFFGDIDCSAIAAKITVEIDREGLDAAEAMAESKNEEDYTAETWAVLQQALALPETTQGEVDAKVAAIVTAIERLAKKPLEPDTPESIVGRDTDVRGEGDKVLTVTAEVVDTTDTEAVKEKIAKLAGKADEATVAEIAEKLSGMENVIVLSADGHGAGKVVLENLTVGTTYYLYHIADDGKMTYEGAFTVDADGKLTIESVTFSGNVLSAVKADLASENLEVGNTGMFVADSEGSAASYALTALGSLAIAGVSFAVLRRKDKRG